jgi:hypothetical protein
MDDKTILGLGGMVSLAAVDVALIVANSSEYLVGTIAAAIAAIAGVTLYVKKRVNKNA